VRKNIYIEYKMITKLVLKIRVTTYAPDSNQSNSRKTEKDMNNILIVVIN